MEQLIEQFYNFPGGGKTVSTYIDWVYLFIYLFVVGRKFLAVLFDFPPTTTRFVCHNYRSVIEESFSSDLYSKSFYSN